MVLHSRSSTVLRFRAVLAAFLLVALLGGSAAATSFDGAIAAFLGDYTSVDVDALEAAIEASLPPSDSVFLASGSLSPLAKAVFALEASDGVLERTRHRVSVRVGLFDQPPVADPVPVVFVQVDRYNLGPALHAELVANLGAEQVAPLAEFGEGPHVSWRFVMRQVMGMEAAIFAAARAEISDSASESLCLGTPCLLTSGGNDEAAGWHELLPVDLAAALDDFPYPALRTGLPSPAAMLDLIATQAYFDPYTSEVSGLDLVIAEFVVEAGLAQEQTVDGALRQGHLLDDSLAAVWQRVVTFAGWDDVPEFYSAQAYECRRGEGEFAAVGEFCL